MIVKGNARLDSYDYLVMFDLASHVSGVCVMDLRTQKIVSHQVIEVGKDEECPPATLESLLGGFFDSLGKSFNGNFFVAWEAMPTQLRGGSSTIQTFLALAKAHAIIEAYCYDHKIPVYDYVGVYPASTHAYYRHINGLPSDHKVEKEEINAFVCKKYGFPSLTLDESDAAFLAETLFGSKWDNDVKELMRERKRHIKELKNANAIKKVQADVDRLASLLINRN